MKIFYFILAVFISVNTCFIYSQTIAGKVQDDLTKLPVQNAKVEIVYNATGFKDSVFTNSNGIWFYNLTTGNDNSEVITPNDFEVYQNYPNPFNPSTVIRFSVSEAKTVRLSVHNILGELIDSKEEFLNGGIYDVVWNSKGAAGVYLYTISTDQNSLTKKMIQLDGGNGNGFGELKNISSSVNKNLGKELSENISLIYSKKTHFADTATYTVGGGENFLIFLKSIHSALRLTDLHNDILEVMVNDPTYHLNIFHDYNHTDIPRLQTGSVDVQFFSVWVSPTEFTDYFHQAQEMLKIFNYELSQNQNKIQQAFTSQQTNQINASGKIAAVIGVEGGHHIENSLENIDSLYNDGMRYMTITWNNSTDWAISAQDNRSATQGLSDFGNQVIKKLDSLGVIIDVSHVGIKTIQDILLVTKNPIVATHSGARAIRNHYRNLYDWQIQDIAKSGGVIGIVFYPPFLTSSSTANVENVIAHIEYIKNLVGIDYVAVGSDFDGIGTNVVKGLEDVSMFGNLTNALIERGYSIEDIEKILSKNFERVFEKVCK